MVEIIKIIDLNEIPNVDKLLGKTFKFSCYDFGDNTRCYSYIPEDDVIEMFEISLICSRKEPIFSDVLFEDLTASEGLVYFSFSIAKPEITNEDEMEFFIETSYLYSNKA